MYFYKVVMGQMAKALTLPVCVKDLPMANGLVFTLRRSNVSDPLPQLEPVGQGALRRTRQPAGTPQPSKLPETFYFLAYYPQQNGELKAIALADESGEIQAGLDLSTSAIPAARLRQIWEKQSGRVREQLQRAAEESLGLSAGSVCLFKPGIDVPSLLVGIKGEFPASFFVREGAALSQAELGAAYNAVLEFAGDTKQGFLVAGMPPWMKADIKTRRHSIATGLAEGRFPAPPFIPKVFGGTTLATELAPLNRAFWLGLTPEQLAVKDANDVVIGRLNQLAGLTAVFPANFQAVQTFFEVPFTVPGKADEALQRRLAEVEGEFRRIFESEEARRGDPKAMLKVVERALRPICKQAPKGYPPSLQNHLLLMYAALREKDWGCGDPPNVFFRYPETSHDKTKDIPAVLPLGIKIPAGVKVVLERSIWEQGINWVQVLRNVFTDRTVLKDVSSPAGPEVDIRKLIALGLNAEVRLSVGAAGNLEVVFSSAEQTSEVLVYKGNVARTTVEVLPKWDWFFEEGENGLVVPRRDLQLQRVLRPLGHGYDEAVNRILARHSISKTRETVALPAVEYRFRSDETLPVLPAVMTTDLYDRFLAWQAA